MQSGNAAMHPFESFCHTRNRPLTGLAEEIGINNATLYRIRTGQGAQTTRKILLWCRKHYIDPYEVFCYQPDDNHAHLNN